MARASPGGVDSADEADEQVDWSQDSSDPCDIGGHDDVVSNPASRRCVAGQTLAVLEAVVGQLFLVVAVGKIISSMRPIHGERTRL